MLAIRARVHLPICDLATNANRARSSFYELHDLSAMRCVSRVPPARTCIEKSKRFGDLVHSESFRTYPDELA